jgi:signal transduction histidine kinase
VADLGRLSGCYDPQLEASCEVLCLDNRPCPEHLRCGSPPRGRRYAGHSEYPRVVVEPDYQVLFEESPDVLLVLRPDAPRYTIVAATRARLVATHTDRDQIGKGLFEVFPDNPDDPAATGTANLRASLERVLATRAPDTMAVQKYDIRGSDGVFQTKYWSPRNLPILSSSGEVAYILHRVEDVTELVRASEIGEELRDRTRAMEREVIRRSRELAEANRDLREANARLGELDAAKTAFFSNISHEFRTPLTLMLGPLEASLQDTTQPLGGEHAARIDMAHANALRLLKLVNALLDFSRLEAGRMTARFVAVDLSKLTAELAGMFQSAIATAQVELAIDCVSASEPAWVDRDMWEKIVCNLVSNAFKFTLAGRIAVRTRESADRFLLEVADTGIGIPAAELSRVFERFHRVAGSSGRTHEGTGIGLSLVRELVSLHGGEVTVESMVGVGSTFRVSIPKGNTHLPADAVSDQRGAETIGRDASAHAAEAARFSRQERPTAVPRGPGPELRAYVVLVDDNPDLRDYIAGLLAPTYEVATAADGEAALELIRRRVPDLVLTDVMMPRLDGFGLARALRADQRTSSLPIILLSARAGEGAAISGLDAGADDYVVKPFAAQELLARVRTHIVLARSRREFTAELERANRELDAFNYAVAHDLRAPLRAIDAYSKVLVEDHGPKLDADGHRCLSRITSNVRRMADLIESMLRLAKVSRCPLHWETVDLSAITSRIIAELHTRHPDRSVTVNIEDALSVRGDRTLLDAALVNLIENAWKFTARVPAAHIEFGRYPGDEPTFFVRDNGAGFDMAHSGLLFRPFHRLHTTEFEGTGVGLATVQRVINRHGGRIWGDATVGGGATFFFTLPERSHVI